MLPIMAMLNKVPGPYSFCVSVLIVLYAFAVWREISSFGEGAIKRYFALRHYCDSGLWYVGRSLSLFQKISNISGRCQTKSMTTLSEIEAAIEKLPAPQVDELAHWLETLRAQRLTSPPIDAWLAQARGMAIPGVTTDNTLDATR
jgi:hypothetical protein